MKNFWSMRVVKINIIDSTTNISYAVSTAKMEETWRFIL